MTLLAISFVVVFVAVLVFRAFGAAHRRREEREAGERMLRALHRMSKPRRRRWPR